MVKPFSMITFNILFTILPCCIHLGIRLILVHGARPQINHNLKQSQIQTPFHQHRRVTTRESLLCDECGGSIRLQIEALLSMGLANSPMYGARIDVFQGILSTAKPMAFAMGSIFS
jgi:amino-acid N-acetyltransferase